MKNNQMIQTKGFTVHSQLRIGTGPTMKTYADFITAFVGDVTSSFPTAKLTTVLNKTNERCKQSNTHGLQCDAWASRIGVPYAKG